MEERKIDLDRILMATLPSTSFDGHDPIELFQRPVVKHWVIRAMKEACTQTLELAAENVGFIKTTSEKLNSEDYVPFITADDYTVWTFDKQSILNTINQIE